MPQTLQFTAIIIDKPDIYLDIKKGNNIYGIILPR